MSVKDFLIGACTAIVGAALGACICCYCCNSTCDDQKCDKPDEKCKMEQSCRGPQDGPRDHHRGDKKECRMEKLANDLNLTDDQKAQIRALEGQQKEAMRAAKASFDSSFQAILTDEQKAKFAEVKACAKERKHCDGKPEGPKPEED